MPHAGKCFFNDTVYLFGKLGGKEAYLLKNVAYFVKPTENLFHTHY